MTHVRRTRSTQARLLSLLIAVGLALPACGAASEADTDEYDRQHTNSAAEGMSAVERARAESACAGYAPAVRPAHNATRDAESGKAYVFLLATLYRKSANSVDALNAPDDTTVGDTITDTYETIDALASKAETFENQGPLDIGYELQAFELADDAVNTACAEIAP